MEETPQNIECSFNMEYKPNWDNINKKSVLNFYIEKLTEQLGIDNLIVNLWQVSTNLEQEQNNGN